MKRIAICSVDDRAQDTVRWLADKLGTHKSTSIMDYRTDNVKSPLKFLLDNLTYETELDVDVSLQIGTRYNIDLCTIDKNGNLINLIHLIERLSKSAGKDLGYDMVFIIHSDIQLDDHLTKDYENIYNLKTKILPNKPASIIGRQIWKFMKFVPKEEKK